MKYVIRINEAQVEEHSVFVNRLFTEEESLLDLPLKAVIEALRMNPDKYNVIYNNKYDWNDSFIS